VERSQEILRAATKAKATDEQSLTVLNVFDGFGGAGEDLGEVSHRVEARINISLLSGYEGATKHLLF